MNKALFSTLLFCCLSIFAMAQQRVVSEQNQPEVLVYSYPTLTGNSAGHLRNMMQEVAPQQFQNASFDLRYNKELRLLESGTRNFTGSATISAVQVQREMTYKGFPLGQSLTPEGVSGAVTFMKNGIAMKSIPFSQRFNAQNTVSVSYPWADTTGGRSSFGIQLDNLEFMYSQQSYNNLRNYIAKINNYEKAANDLNVMGATLSGFNITNPNPDLVMPMINDVKGMEQNFGLIQTADFWQVLGLRNATSQQQDPLQINPMSAAFQQKLNSAKAALGGVAANLHRIYYDRALNAYQSGRKQEAMTELGKSLNSNPNFTPSHYLTAVIDFETGEFKRSEDRIQNLVNNMNPPNEIRNDAFSLANSLRDKYLKDGSDFARDKQYAKAISAYQRALDFGKSLRGYNAIEPEIQQLIVEARKSELSDMAAEMQRLYQNKDFPNALKATDAAIDYQKKYNITSDYDLPRFRATILSDDYRNRLSKVETYLQNKQAGDARNELMRCEEFFVKYKSELDGHPNVASFREKAFNSTLQALTDEAFASLGNAKQTRQSGNAVGALPLADAAVRQLSSAQDFYTKNRTIITFNPDFRDLNLKCQTEKYRCHYALARKELSVHQYDTALQNAEEAERVAASHAVNLEGTGNPTELVVDVQRARYANFVRQGDDLSKSGKNKEALEMYNAAKSLDQKYGGIFSGQQGGVGEKMSATAKQDVLTKVNALVQYSTDNDELRREQATLRQFADQYGLANDGQVNDALNSLQNKICQNAEYILYTNKMNEVDAAVKAQNYQVAKTALAGAEAVLREYAGCRIKNERYTNIKDQVEACAIYQKTVQAAKQEEDKRDFKKAIDKHLESVKMYKEEPLVNKNLPTPSAQELKGYVLSLNIPDFMVAAAEHYSNQEDINTSYELMKTAISKNVNVNSTGALQTRLGRAQAEQLFKPGLKWKDTMMTLFPKELCSRMKNFRTAFKKRWKELD